MHIPAKSHSHFAGAPAAVLAFAALAAMALAGCAGRSLSSQTFPAAGAQTAWNVEYGEVVDVRPAEVEGEISLLGVLVGSAVGHAVGTEVSGSSNAGAVGAIAGAAAGAAIEQAVTGKSAQQITVDLDSGSTVAIVQDDEDRFQNGERVRVLTANIVTPGPTPVRTGGIFGGSRGIGRTGAPFPVTRARVQHL